MERRDFLKAAAILAAAQPSFAAEQANTATEMPRAAHAPRNAPAHQALLFLNDAEAAAVAAAVDVFIPADETGPGGVEAGVVRYVDRQLAGAWGQGARWYLQGPWAEGSPQQGYQLPLTPAQLYRIALAELDIACQAAHGGHFAKLDAGLRNQVLNGLDAGEFKLATVPGKVFLNMLLANAVEGYFADPAYGGNQGMAAWRMIGFPGARGAYVDDIVTYRGKPFAAEPVSLADLQ